MGYRLLVVEGDSTPADASVQSALARDSDFGIQRLSWDATGPDALARKGPHAVVAVAVPHTPKVTHIFEWLRDHPIHTPMLVVLPPEPGDPLLRLGRQVSDDFLLSPIRRPELRERLERVLGVPNWKVAAVRDRLLEEIGITQIVGRDPVFLEAIRRVPQFARSEAPVLITGETGTGKELCARAIHFLSSRRDCPFVAVDCAALPDHLVENELFGHARGAYTDAHRDQRGLVAMAEGGTLFLDEIDALSLTAQGKLLRFLQDQTFRPLGGDRFQRADLHVLAATNKDLEDGVRQGQFRADLFYRLNVLRLHLPPLRQRLDDIPALAVYFLRECQTPEGPTRVFSPAALRMLGCYDWPGPVRELANVVQRAMVTCDRAQVLPCHITLPGLTDSSSPVPTQFRTARAAAVAAFERRYVEDLLRKCGGNVTHAAREANKERRAFGRLIKKHGIDRLAVASRSLPAPLQRRHGDERDGSTTHSIEKPVLEPL